MTYALHQNPKPSNSHSAGEYDVDARSDPNQHRPGGVLSSGRPRPCAAMRRGHPRGHSFERARGFIPEGEGALWTHRCAWGGNSQGSPQAQLRAFDRRQPPWHLAASPTVLVLRVWISSLMILTTYHRSYHIPSARATTLRYVPAPSLSPLGRLAPDGRSTRRRLPDLASQGLCLGPTASHVHPSDIWGPGDIWGPACLGLNPTMCAEASAPILSR